MFDDATKPPKEPTTAEKILFEHSEVHEANVLEILGFAGCLALGVGTYHLVHDRGFPAHFAHDQQEQAVSGAEKNNQKLEDAKNTLSDAGATGAVAEVDKVIANNNAFVLTQRANPAAPEYNGVLADVTSIGSAFIIGGLATAVMFRKAHKMNRHYLAKKQAFQASIKTGEEEEN